MQNCFISIISKPPVSLLESDRTTMDKKYWKTILRAAFGTGNFAARASRGPNSSHLRPSSTVIITTRNNNDDNDNTQCDHKTSKIIFNVFPHPSAVPLRYSIRNNNNIWLLHAVRVRARPTSPACRRQIIYAPTTRIVIAASELRALYIINKNTRRRR